MMNIDALLQGVQKPARYIGGEYNSIKKSWDKTAVKICLAYPDVYEVGMSYLGIKLLYHLLNNMPDVLCERVFAPWPDMEGSLRESSVPLFSLESRRPLKEFDIIGFSLGYELTYTNFINMLDLGRIPIFSKERRNDDAVIIAGGVCVFNPVPLSEFVDIFFIGEAEESILEFLNVFKELKKKMSKRKDLLNEAGRIEGLYIPSIHKENKIKKRIVRDFENSFYPTKPIVPYIQTVHDRLAIEIMRGCPNQCRFCQARVFYKPVRLRSTNKILELSNTSLENTGYEEVSFLSLSSSNHPYLFDIIRSFSERESDKGINISVPSLRIEEVPYTLPALIAKNRKTGFTFAPESAGPEMRKKLNKPINLDKLFSTAKSIFESGWKRIKLYFMLGLPGEGYKDLDGIAELAYRLSDLKREIDGKRALITLSINNFIPKPHTAFQWLGMEDKKILFSKQDYLRQKIKDNKIKLDFQDLEISFLEASLSRGERNFNNIIYSAWKKGARFDGWRNLLKIDAWENAFSEEGLSLYTYPTKQFSPNDKLAWDFIDTGTPRKELLEEARQAGLYV